MIKRYFLSLISIMVLFATNSIAKSHYSLGEIAKFANDYCLSPKATGTHLKIKTKADGGARIKFIGALKGEVDISHEEWDGLQKVLPNEQLEDNISHRKCKEGLLPFLEKVFFSPNNKTGDSTSFSDNISNLVINGDFAKHWSYGWKKGVRDKTTGLMNAELINSTSDPSDNILHLSLSGKNAGWVEQHIELSTNKNIENLHLEFEMKTETKTTGFNLGEPIEASFLVQFNNKNKKNIGQIFYSAGQKGAFEDTGLPGAPISLRSDNSRCIIKTNPSYQIYSVNLFHQYINCFNKESALKIRSIELVAFLQTELKNQSADLYLDNVKLFYKD